MSSAGIHISNSQVEIPYIITNDIVSTRLEFFEVIFLKRTANHYIYIMQARQFLVVLQIAGIIMIFNFGVVLLPPALTGIGTTVVGKRTIPLVKGNGFTHIGTVARSMIYSRLQVQF